ncbi:unnamed protein product [Prorocentrum cordatum]|uniref:Uncharacterized protein n=1 Tax=Prorocentrum cordatum TaxID=2364126 RepID=A0ABN9VIG4_9DINO|nr:unnamed protein product [Polarella glacialis]
MLENTAESSIGTNNTRWEVRPIRAASSMASWTVRLCSDTIHSATREHAIVTVAATVANAGSANISRGRSARKAASCHARPPASATRGLTMEDTTFQNRDLRRDARWNRSPKPATRPPG